MSGMDARLQGKQEFSPENSCRVSENRTFPTQKNVGQGCPITAKQEFSQENSCRVFGNTTFPKTL